MPEDDLSDTTFIVDLGTVLYDMAYNKADGEIYAVTENNELVTIDKLTGAMTKLGKIGVKTNTLACDGDGTFFCNQLGTGRVYSFTLDTKSAPTMLMEDPFLTDVDPISGADMGGTTGNMGMEYNPNTGMLCWNSHCEVLIGSYITFAYYYEIDPETGAFTRYNDFWHEMSCLMIPDETGRSNSWAEPTEDVIGVQLNKNSVELIKGTTTQLTANVQPWTAVDRTVTWFSANESIATVDQNGVVTAVAPGTTTITATSQLDPSKKASCQVTVDLLYVTLHGTLMDDDGDSMFYSWNMAEDDTWTPGASIPVTMTSATWSDKDEVFYIMDSTEALEMHKVDETGKILASAANENNIPLWDMAYSNTFSTDAQEMVSSIYYSYLLSPKDPMALDAVGFDLSSMCSYLVGMTSFGSERVADESGNQHDTEHLVLLDNDGYIWHFWIYAREGGGYDALYAIDGTNLECAFPGDESMEHMYTSLMVGEDGNLYLSTYDGETSEIYYLVYDSEDENYVAAKVGEMGRNVWPATITSVTVNGNTAANAVHPQPEYTMSSTTFTREELAAASVSDGSKENLFRAADEAKRNLELGLTMTDSGVEVYAAGTQADPIPLVEGDNTGVAPKTGTDKFCYFSYTAAEAGTATVSSEGTAWRAYISVYDADGNEEGSNATMYNPVYDGSTITRELEAGGKFVLRISPYVSYMYGGEITVNFHFAAAGGSTPDPEPCQHTNVGDWVTTDETNHWKVCADCGEKVNEAAHSFGSWVDGKKTCTECGRVVICQYDGLLSSWKYDDDNHWKTCYTCSEVVNKAAHSYVDGECECGKTEPVADCEHEYGDWVDGKKTCSKCGDVVTCQHPTTEVRDAAEASCTEKGYTGDTYCTVCGMMTAEGEDIATTDHDYVDGFCADCGKAEPAEDTLVLGSNTGLTVGEVYTYTPTEDGRLEFDFTMKDSTGTAVYQYAYGKGTRVKILINDTYIPNLADTKVTVSKDDTVTVELVSVDGDTYTAALTLTAIEAAAQLQLGDNAIAKDADYSFIAPQDGTLYTTVKELWYDSTYCSEVSLSSTIVFRINGVAIDSFRNSFEVEAGDEITVLLGTSFLEHSANAVLNLSYEGFYQHPKGSRGNPYVLLYSDCPTVSAEIPADSTVWYQLSGFGSGYYLTVTGEDAYVIVGSKQYNAVDGSVTVSAPASLQIGNAGSETASFGLSAYIEEGTAGNPKDLVSGDNSVTLPERGNYWYDFKATQAGTATFTVSGDNWGYQYTLLAADGAEISQSEMLYQYKGNEGTVTQALTAGQSIVIKLGTMDSSWTQVGGKLKVNFSFVGEGGEEPVCQHENTEIRGAKDPTCTEPGYTGNEWCLDCGEMIETGESIDATGHDYQDGVCVDCGEADPDAEPACEHKNTEIRDAEDATCTEKGYTGDTWCTDCETKIATGSTIPATGHTYEDGVCVDCGAAEPVIDPEAVLVLGNNTLTSGKIYTHTVAEDGRLEFDFTSVKDSAGTTVYQYGYGRGTRVKILVNDTYIPNLLDTKVSVSEGDTVTVELVSVDDDTYTAALTLSALEPAAKLTLGDNTLAKDVDYSFIAEQDGTLYTTIKELWCDGVYCSAASLSSSVVFRINGVVINSFNNSYAVEAGDEITVLLGTSFDTTASAILNLSYEGFYQHPKGSRGNPYTLLYSECPTESVSIPGGSAVWYQLSGFSGGYLTVTGANAYVVVGGVRRDAVNGSVTVPAYTSLQIGNAGATAAVFGLSGSFPEGIANNPKDLAEGRNIVELGESENYYYDFVATEDGIATVTVSGDNWRFWFSHLNANGEYVVQEADHRQTRGDSDTVEVGLTAGESIVLKLGTIDANWKAVGGTLTVEFSFVAGDTCSHSNEAGEWQFDDNNHWQICDSCGEQFNKDAHSYENGECICGKADPDAECDHDYGDWVNGKKTCSKCGNIVKCQHANTVLKNKKDATCTEEGYTGDRVCTLCNTVTVKGEATPATGHSYEEGICTACGEKDPDYRPIISKEITCSEFTTNGVVTVSWENPDEMALVGIEIHADYSSVMEDRSSVTFGYVSIDGIAAGESVATLYFEVVDPEKAVVTVVFDEFNNPSDGCAHAVTEVRGKKDATCTEDGYTGDTYCTDCGKKVATGKIAPATGHYAEKTFVWAEDLSSATMVCSCGDVSAACTMAWDNSTPGVMVFTASVMVDGKLYTDSRVITSTREGDKVTVLLPAGVSGVVIYAAAYNSANQMTDCASQYVTGSSVTLTISGDNIRLFFLNSDYCPVSDHMAA